MIEKVAHLADIHIRKSIERHKEYRQVFDKLYKKLKSQSPDRILVVGDIYDNFIDIEGEALILVAEFLNKLSEISKVIVTVGNHDIRKKHRSRVNTIETVLTLIDNPNVIYYNQSGFYEDENVVWVVWDHVDELNPWKDIKHKKIPDKIYIDLYHNPVNGCKLFNGLKMENKKYPTIRNFKGDLSFFGDIHLRQFFSNGKKAYCGSLIQQDFGESVDNHGYLLWDINNKTYEEINIENEYKFVNIKLDKNVNYDDIEIPSVDNGDKIKVKIKWEDYSDNINTENELKIRNLIKNQIGTDNIIIESTPLITDITESIVSESIDILDNDEQKKLIKEFLTNNKISEDVIDDIIKIDDLITSRLEMDKVSNINWGIDRLWFNNFKSYGDDNIIDWVNKNGIIQIMGVNQQGKSTILDAITYILYGNTLATTKREKNGDNRYINVHRDLDYCDGGAIVDVNGEKYTIYRKTVRKKKKDNSISSVSSYIEYYKGTEMVDDNKLVGETNVETQKKINSILGDFEDFIRLTLTNADNINNLLSMDRSVFIDNVIRDAGFDIFEKKLSEFKSYKKSLKLDRIHLNLTETNNEIKTIKSDIKDLKKERKDLENKLTDLNNMVKKLTQQKEKLIKSRFVIDDDISNINIDDLESSINKLNEEIVSNKKSISILNEEINELNIDNEDNIDKIYSDINNKIDDINKNVMSITLEISDIDTEISELTFGIKKIEMDTERKIDSIKNSILTNKRKIESEIKILENDINNIKRNGKTIKIEIDKLEGTDGVKVCPTCLRKIDDDNEHIKKEIINRKQTLKELLTDGKSKQMKIKELEKQLYDLDNVNIEDNDDYQKVIKYKNESIIKITNTIKEKEKIKEELNNNKEELNSKLVGLLDEQKELKIIKDKIDKKHKIEIDIKNKEIKIYEISKDLSILNDKKTKYYDNIDKLNKNIEIDNRVSDISDKIDNINIELNNVGENLSTIDKDLVLKDKVVKDLVDKIDKFKEQERLDMIHNLYMKTVHRDGIPTYLLKKSINVINNELSKLMTTLDFNLLFDSELNLKMKSKIDGRTYNAIEGSGMERTFSSCALKMSLRKINNKSKPDFILFDEIMNKLVGRSVDSFIEFLYEMKNHINKIIIIEHIHQMKYDYVIDVNKDEDGISSLNLY
jgi:DNA repair exonuclease SbcCD ATPase subunit